MRAYVQSHQTHSNLLDEADQVRFEGCAEIWFDSDEDAKAFPQELIYARDIIPDEPLFVDMKRLRFAFTTEEVLCSGPDLHDQLSPGDAAWRIDNRPVSCKLLQFIEAAGPDDWDHADDATLGRRIGALRHVRCRPSREVHPDGAFVVGIRELWWPTKWDMQQGVAADKSAWHALIDRPERATAFVADAERFF
jgi:hypothetical protein